MHRQVVDYALAKRSCLAQVRAGRTAVAQVCDAGVYLLRAAQFHGESTHEMCPICRKEPVTLVRWIFGDSLGKASGTARTVEEITRIAAGSEEFTVHVVEVCRTCHWNHLVQSYVEGLTPRTVRTRRAAK
ncbi:MAG: DUF5318 family protein [Gordonia sp. (in: high G+C Gram-positive bacteria)]